MGSPFGDSPDGGIAQQSQRIEELSGLRRIGAAMADGEGGAPPFGGSDGSEREIAEHGLTPLLNLAAAA